jgi:hypothetical protein
LRAISEKNSTQPRSDRRFEDSIPKSALTSTQGLRYGLKKVDNAGSARDAAAVTSSDHMYRTRLLQLKRINLKKHHELMCKESWPRGPGFDLPPRELHYAIAFRVPKVF